LKKFKEVKKFKIIRGKGLEGEINRKKILIGNRALMKENNISLKKIESKLIEFERNAYTTMIVSENKEPIGRPRQIYIGEVVRHYVPIEER
jgi:cation transport ATPase